MPKRTAKKRYSGCLIRFKRLLVSPNTDTRRAVNAMWRIDAPTSGAFMLKSASWDAMSSLQLDNVTVYSLSSSSSL